MKQKKIIAVPLTTVDVSFTIEEKLVVPLYSLARWRKKKWKPSPNHIKQPEKDIFFPKLSDFPELLGKSKFKGMPIKVFFLCFYEEEGAIQKWKILEVARQLNLQPASIEHLLGFSFENKLDPLGPSYGVFSNMPGRGFYVCEVLLKSLYLYTFIPLKDKYIFNKEQHKYIFLFIEKT